MFLCCSPGGLILYIWLFSKQDVILRTLALREKSFHHGKAGIYLVLCCPAFLSSDLFRLLGLGSWLNGKAEPACNNLIILQLRSALNEHTSRLKVLKRRNEQLRLTHSHWLSLYLCTVFKDLDRWAPTCLECQSSDRRLVEVLAPTKQMAFSAALQADTQHRPAPKIGQCQCANPRGGSEKSRWKTQTERGRNDGQDRWSVWSFCVYPVSCTLQRQSDLCSPFLNCAVIEEVL